MSCAEEMSAVLPGDAALVYKSQVRLMDQRRGLECVIGTLAMQVLLGESL